MTTSSIAGYYENVHFSPARALCQSLSVFANNPMSQASKDFPTVAFSRQKKIPFASWMVAYSVDYRSTHL
jgi:hypothetical protein